jgi:hypothetical protein
VSADVDCRRFVKSCSVLRTVSLEGCDLLAAISLSGNSPDWALVNRTWQRGRTLVGRPWDEISGFEIASGASDGRHDPLTPTIPPSEPDNPDQSRWRLYPAGISSVLPGPHELEFVGRADESNAAGTLVPTMVIVRSIP